MPVDPQIQVMLEQVAAIDAPPVSEQTPEEARLALAMLSGLGLRPERVETDDLTIAAAGRSIPARRYRPPGPGPRPALVGFHGGGYVLGDLDTHDAVWAHLAEAAEALVVAVDYRRAPEHRLPAAIDDGELALGWVVEHAPELGADPGRVGVGGDSAGGHLAANVALRARDRGAPVIAALLLLYPWLTWDLDQPSMEENAEGYLLTREAVAWFRDLAAPEAGGTPAFLSPLEADLAGLPPTVVATAQYDPLRDQGNEVARRLEAAGVPVTHLPSDGLVHAFAQLTAICESARRACDEIARELGELLHG